MSPKQQKVEIEAFSALGELVLYLPRTFRGFITTTNKLGSTSFSPSISQTLTVLHQNGTSTKYFLGSFDPHELGDGPETWTEDLVQATNKLGSIYIGYADEKSGTQASRSGGMIPDPYPFPSPSR